MVDPHTPNVKNERGLLSKAKSKVADLVNIFEPKVSKAAVRRSRHKAQTLSLGEDIFHNYRTPQSASDQRTQVKCGKKPYEWTPARTESLRRLVVHSDVKFDDVHVAMRDEAGNGPWYIIEPSCQLYNANFLAANQHAAIVGMKSLDMPQTWLV